MIRAVTADSSHVVIRAAWQYTRSSESIRMEVQEESTRFLLVIRGDGQQWHHQACTDYLEAMRAQFAYEEQFLARGFVLARFNQRPAVSFEQ